MESVSENESRLIDYQTRLNVAMSGLQKVTGPYRKAAKIESAMQDITALYNEKLASMKPQIMVYGIYNAGKSSIINELIRDDRAKVEDKPTTDKVEKYAWRGYEIADTPGVGAPIKHEDVTNEHLKRADLVLFVMSSTGACEKAENYIRMKDIVDAGKQVIIILNDKSGAMGTLKGENEITELKIKIGFNMRQVGIDDKQYIIVVVNAKRAHKGRIESKAILYEKSNFAELERVLWQELKKTNSFTLLDRTIGDIIKNVEKIVEAMQRQKSMTGIKPLQDLMGQVRQEQKKQRDDIHNKIKERMNKLSRDLPSAIWAQRENPEGQNAAVSEKVKKAVELVQHDLQNTMDDFDSVLASDITRLRDAMKEQAGDLDVNGSGAVKDLLSATQQMLDNYNQKGDFLLTPDTDVLGEAGAVLTDAIGGSAGAGVAQEVGEQVLKKAAELAAKKIGSKVLSKAIAGMVPYVGQVLVIASTIYSVVNGYLNRQNEKRKQEIEAQNELQRQQAAAEQQMQEELAQKCCSVAEDMADNFIIATDKMLRERVEGIIKKLTAVMDQTCADEEHLSNDVQAVRDILVEYEVLRQEISNNL